MQHLSSYCVQVLVDVSLSNDEDDAYNLLSTYSVPGTVLNALLRSYWILTTFLWGRHYFRLSFSDEVIGALKVKCLDQSYTGEEGGGPKLYSGLSPEPTQACCLFPHVWSIIRSSQGCLVLSLNRPLSSCLSWASFRPSSALAHYCSSPLAVIPVFTKLLPSPLHPFYHQFDLPKVVFIMLVSCSGRDWLPVIGSSPSISTWW